MDKRELFVGIDLGGTNIKSGLVASSGDIVEEIWVATEVDKGVKDVLDRVGHIIRGFIDNVNGETVIRGVGMGIPGQIDVRNGLLKESPNLPGWDEIHIDKELKKRTGLDIMVDNDANIAALGEYAYGAGRGVTEMFMVTLGTGVGGGLILNGNIYRGATRFAGEFGHMSIDQNGPRCACGRRGCVEAYVGLNGILRLVKEKLIINKQSLLKDIDLKKLTPKDIYHAALKGDEVAVEVFRQVGEYLGIGLGNVINLLNIERVVVGGGISKAGEFILGPARESLSKVALKVCLDIVSVVPASFVDKAGIVGAARLVMLNGG